MHNLLKAFIGFGMKTLVETISKSRLYAHRPAALFFEGPVFSYRRLLRAFLLLSSSLFLLASTSFFYVEQME